MRCHICNTPIQKIKFDYRDGSILPCNTCEEVAFDALGELMGVTQTDLDYAHDSGYTLYEEDSF
jgi:hypothetical protein